MSPVLKSSGPTVVTFGEQEPYTITRLDRSGKLEIAVALTGGDRLHLVANRDSSVSMRIVYDNATQPQMYFGTMTPAAARLLAGLLTEAADRADLLSVSADSAQ